MLSFINYKIASVWLLLIVATLISLWLSVDLSASYVKSTGISVLLLAFLKARLIGYYFMELRHAPHIMLFLFDSWCVGTMALLVGLYVY